MAFGHGKNAKIYVGGYDITSYLTEFGVTLNGETADVTTLGATWHDVLAGVKSGSFTGNGFFDGAASAQNAIINALTNTSSVWLYFPQDDTLGNGGFGVAGVQVSYNPTSPVGGASTFTFSGTADKNIDLLVSLHALGAETATGNGISVDNGAATTNGGAAYLIVTAYSGLTSADFKVQHSADDAIWADLATFTQVTAANQKEQVIVAAGVTVNRYLRAVRTLGGAGSVTFTVGFGRR